MAEKKTIEGKKYPESATGSLNVHKKTTGRILIAVTALRATNAQSTTKSVRSLAKWIEQVGADVHMLSEVMPNTVPALKKRLEERYVLHESSDNPSSGHRINVIAFSIRSEQHSFRADGSQPAISEDNSSQVEITSLPGLDQTYYAPFVRDDVGAFYGFHLPGSLAMERRHDQALHLVRNCTNDCREDSFVVAGDANLDQTSATNIETLKTDLEERKVSFIQKGNQNHAKRLTCRGEYAFMTRGYEIVHSATLLHPTAAPISWHSKGMWSDHDSTGIIVATRTVTTKKSNKQFQDDENNRKETQKQLNIMVHADSISALLNKLNAQVEKLSVLDQKHRIVEIWKTLDQKTGLQEAVKAALVIKGKNPVASSSGDDDKKSVASGGGSSSSKANKNDKKNANGSDADSS